MNTLFIYTPNSGNCDDGIKDSEHTSYIDFDFDIDFIRSRAIPALIKGGGVTIQLTEHNYNGYGNALITVIQLQTTGYGTKRNPTVPVVKEDITTDLGGAAVYPSKTVLDLIAAIKLGHDEALIAEARDKAERAAMHAQLLASRAETDERQLLAKLKAKYDT